nr:peritrophin [Sipunculus nudus]
MSELRMAVLWWITVAVLFLSGVTDAQTDVQGKKTRITHVLDLFLSDYTCTTIIRKCVRAPELCGTRQKVIQCISSTPEGKNCDLDTRFSAVFNEAFLKCQSGVSIGTRSYIVHQILDLTKDNHTCINKIQQCFQDAGGNELHCSKPDEVVNCIGSSDECPYLTRYWPLIHDAFLRTCPDQVKILGDDLVLLLVNLRTSLKCARAVQRCFDVDNPLASCGDLDNLAECLHEPCEEIKRHIPVILDTLFKVCRDKDNYFVIGDPWQLASRPTETPEFTVAATPMPTPTTGLMNQTKRHSILDEIIQLEKENSVCREDLLNCVVKHPTDGMCTNAAALTYCVAEAKGCRSLLEYWYTLSKVMEDYCYRAVVYDGRSLMEQFLHVRMHKPVCLENLKRCFNFDYPAQSCQKTNWLKVRECIAGINTCPNMAKHSVELQTLLKNFCYYPAGKIVVWKYKFNEGTGELPMDFSLLSIIEEKERNNQQCVRIVRKCFANRTTPQICGNAWDVFRCIAQTDGCAGLIHYWTMMESWVHMTCPEPVIIRGVALVEDLLNAAMIDTTCIRGVSNCFDRRNPAVTCSKIDNLSQCMNEVKTCPTLTPFWPVFDIVWKRLCAHKDKMYVIDVAVLKPLPTVPPPVTEGPLVTPRPRPYPTYPTSPPITPEPRVCDGTRRVDPTSCRRFYQCQCEELLAACPRGLYYNHDNQMCDQPYNVKCTTEDASASFNCPEPNGIFPDEKNCIGFYICFQNKPKHMQCPKRSSLQ